MGAEKVWFTRGLEGKFKLRDPGGGWHHVMGGSEGAHVKTRGINLKKKMAGLLRVRGASQVVQVCREGEKVLRGASMKDIAMLRGENGRGIGLIVDGNGLIADLGCVFDY